MVVAVVFCAAPRSAFPQGIAGGQTGQVGGQTGQVGGQTGQVGGQTGQGGQAGQAGNAAGILVDANGVVRPAFLKDSTGQLNQKRREELAGKSLPADLNRFSPLRKVSLVQLEAACKSFADEQKHVTGEMQYLAGLQRIDYVFIYPEEKDIVIAGPAEGFLVDPFGRAIGNSTGRPPLRLDDLIVALRALQRNRGNVGCSIDPVPENLAQLKAYIAQNSSPTSKQNAVARIEQMRRILGMEDVRVFGVPSETHFGESLVEADLRMKRLSLGLDPAPIRGFKSHLAFVGPGENTIQRWWFTPLYDAFTRSGDGLAFQISGQRVQLLSEEEVVSDAGRRSSASFTHVSIQKFSKQFTEKFPELADAVPVFAELQSLFDLLVMSALLKKEQAAERVGWRMELFLDTERATIVKRNVPRQVEAAMNQKSGFRGLVIGLLGGVQIDPWQTVAGNDFRSDSKGVVGEARTKALPEKRPDEHRWWWD
jgi:hypothetical protein